MTRGRSAPRATSCAPIAVVSASAMSAALAEALDERDRPGAGLCADRLRRLEQRVHFVAECDHVDAVAVAQQPDHVGGGSLGMRERLADHAAGAIDDDRDILRGDRLLGQRRRGQRQHEPAVLGSVRLDERARCPVRVVDVPLEDQLTGGARTVGSHPGAARRCLDVEAMRRRPQVAHRAIDGDHDLGVGARDRRAIPHRVPAAREPPGPAQLDALVLAGQDRKHLERERALAIRLEQARIAAARGDAIVDPVRGLAFQHLTDDLRLAVPVRKAIDVAAGPGPQPIAPLDLARTGMPEHLQQRRRRVLAVDRYM